LCLTGKQALISSNPARSLLATSTEFIAVDETSVNVVSFTRMKYCKFVAKQISAIDYLPKGMCLGETCKPQASPNRVG